MTRRLCGAVHPDGEIVCTKFEHTRDHHRGWCQYGHAPVPVHWGADAARVTLCCCLKAKGNR